MNFYLILNIILPIILVVSGKTCTREKNSPLICDLDDTSKDLLSYLPQSNKEVVILNVSGNKSKKIEIDNAVLSYMPLAEIINIRCNDISENNVIKVDITEKQRLKTLLISKCRSISFICIQTDGE